MTRRPDVPIACALSQQDRTQQVARIQDLRHALRDVQRGPLTLSLAYATEATAQLREVVAVESTCCGFLNFDLREGVNSVQLTITSPGHAHDAAQVLFDQFAPATTRSEAS